MHRILAFLFIVTGLIFAAGQSFGQLTLTGAGKNGPGGFTPSCTESGNFLSRTSGLDVTHETNYNTLICGLVTDGVCCSPTSGVLDALYIWTTADSTTAKLNLTQSAYLLNQTGSITFTADSDYTGDGATGFFDTGFNILTSVGNWAPTSGTLGCYIFNNRTASQNYTSIGLSGSFNDSRLIPLLAAGPGGFLYSVSFTSVQFYPANTSSQGSWTATRTGATTTNLYLNGSTTPVATSASSNTIADNLSLYAFAFNNGGSAAGFSGDSMGACYFGAGMTATQASNTQTRINTYMTAYHVNVYP